MENKEFNEAEFKKIMETKAEEKIDELRNYFYRHYENGDDDAAFLRWIEVKISNRS
jgi:hypothetical protein